MFEELAMSFAAENNQTREMPMQENEQTHQAPTDLPEESGAGPKLPAITGQGTAPAMADRFQVSMSESFRASEVSGSKDRVFSDRLGQQVFSCLAAPIDAKSSETDRRAVAALSAMREIGPRNGLEGMLASQMVAAQNVSMEFLSRSLRASPSQGGYYARQGTQLMALFVRQAELLQRLRGRERRSLRVERERVHEGGRTSVSAEREEVR